jgi:hypothetical protein
MPHLTPRWVLQYWGTEVCRKGFHDNIWITSLENKLRNSKDNIVISDCRFPNEIKAIHNAGGIIIRVKRGEDPEWYDAAVSANKGPNGNANWALSQRKLEKLKIHAIKNEKTLAAQLRKNTNLKDLLIKNLENDADALKISLISFFADNSDDVMRIATAARNSFVHGDLTAGGAGLSVNARVDAIENLAKVLMNYCDELFSKCLKRIEAK